MVLRLTLSELLALTLSPTLDASSTWQWIVVAADGRVSPIPVARSFAVSLVWTSNGNVRPLLQNKSLPIRSFEILGRSNKERGCYRRLARSYFMHDADAYLGCCG